MHQSGVQWCIEWYYVSMDKRGFRPRALPQSTRASVSFPIGIYQELEKIAASKKVSLAWVVREAAEHYIAGQWPLLAPTRGDPR